MVKAGLYFLYSSTNRYVPPTEDELGFICCYFSCENGTNCPMNSNENYLLKDGRVVTNSLEIHIVDHCNLKCWGCCSLSPISSTYSVSPEQIAKDLSLAKPLISPKRLKLVGGEPLLHKRIVDCLKVAREAGIAPSVSVTTNGFLLNRVDRAFWTLVDHITVSLYPDPVLPDKTIDLIKQQAEDHDVNVNWKTQAEFVTMDRDNPDSIGVETKEIYKNCWLRRRCHLIANGRFYTCTRPAHFHSVSGLDNSKFEDDGVLLDAKHNIIDYLIRKKPLNSCYLCLGGNSSTKPHRQLSLSEVKQESLKRQSIYREYNLYLTQ